MLSTSKSQISLTVGYRPKLHLPCYIERQAMQNVKECKSRIAVLVFASWNENQSRHLAKNFCMSFAGAGAGEALNFQN